MTEPIYFESPAAWRAWLEEHHATETEVWVGMWKAHTGRAVLTWELAVREALCFGWIDGVARRVGPSGPTPIGDSALVDRSGDPVGIPPVDGTGNPTRVDDERKAQRFTPRKSTTWSAKNVRMVGELEAAGLMRDAGRAAFAARVAAADYAVATWTDRLPDELEAQLREDAAAAAFWEAAPPSYRKLAVYHVTSARRPETVAKRLAQLIADSAAGLRLKQHRR